MSSASPNTATAAHIRIFPHSREEFASQDALTMWLLTALKAQDGVYNLRSKRELPPGSVVLFRYGRDFVVGEAVVAKCSPYSPPHEGHTLAGEHQQYEAYVRFLPSSIRIYSPPVGISVLQSFIVGDSPNLVPSAQPYFKIGWNVYPKLLAHIAKSGAFI